MLFFPNKICSIYSCLPLIYKKNNIEVFVTFHRNLQTIVNVSSLLIAFVFLMVMLYVMGS